MFISCFENPKFHNCPYAEVKTLGPVVIGGDNLPSPVRIGLNDLPNIEAPLAPPVPASLLCMMSTHRTVWLFVAWNGILQPYYSLRTTQATNGLLTFMHSVDVWHKKGQTFAHQRWQRFKDHKKRWTQIFCHCFTVAQLTQIPFTFSNLILNLDLDICLSPWSSGTALAGISKEKKIWICMIVLFNYILLLKVIWSWKKLQKSSKNKSGWIAEH